MHAAFSIMRNLHRKTCNSIIARKQFFFNGMNVLKQHCKNTQTFFFKHDGIKKLTLPQIMV